MKKFMILAAATIIFGTAVEAKRVPEKVQGTPYAQTLKKAKGAIMPAWEWDPNPDAPALPQKEFTFDDIQSWTGEGSKKAALVIQWNDPRETHAVVFGYRWDGLATGADMIRAVVSNNPRLYGLIQYTNVSSPTDPNGGYTINGFGWDADSDGEIELYDKGKDDYYTSEDGLFIHPRGYNPEVGGSSDYDYDNWKAVDSDDFWQAGWYVGYWSYWVKDSSEGNFGYSGWGASGRVLEDGSWDGWNYAVDMMSSDWKEFKAAPSSIPEGAKTEFEVNGLYYSLTDFQSGKVKLVNPATLASIENPSSYSGVIEVPSEFIDEEKIYTVKEIDAEAFKGSAVTSVTLPASVTKIGENAFANSTLSELKGADGADLTKTITSLGKYAFDGCGGFKELFLPEALTSVPEGLFKDCGLTEITIPSRIVSISESAFENNKALVSIELPKSVIEIGSKAFSGCESLESVKVNSVYPPAGIAEIFSESTYAVAALRIPTGFEETYKAADVWKNFVNIECFNIPVNNGDLFALNDVTFKVNLEEEDEFVIVSYPKVNGKPTKDNIKAANALLEGEIVIPEKVNYMGKELPIKAISDSAFYGASNITSVVVNAKIESIPNQAFYDCAKLESVSLPQGLKSIDEYAFSYAGVKNLTLPESVESLGERAFFQCGNLESINIPQGLRSIPRYCFSYCRALTSLSFGDQIESIGDYAMQNCSALTSVKLPNNLTTISNSLFSNCSSLENLIIPEAVTSIGASAFSACSKLIIELPSSVESLGSSSLAGVANETIAIPSSITVIPYGLFSGCKNLKSVALSDDVTTFDNSVFQNCSALSSLTVVDSDIQTLSDEAAGIIFPSKLTSIGNYCFQGCLGLTNVSIPEGVTKVGQNLFYRCSNLEEVSLPNSVTTLQSGMFQECKGLKKLTLGSAITSIPQNFVRDCNELEWVVIKGNEEKAEIGKLELPETVTTIASWTFANCKKLTEAVIPSKVTNLQMNTFDGCSSLAKVQLPDALTTLGNYVFRNTALKELELPENVSTGYSSDIVYGCNDIKIYVCNTGTPKTISTNAFRVATGIYAPIFVPIGKKGEYEGMNYWKNSVISEPNAKISFEASEEDSDDTNNAYITVEVDVTLEEGMPTRFSKANGELLLDEADFELLWRVSEEVEETPNTDIMLVQDETEGSDATDFKSEAIELNSDRQATLSIPRWEEDVTLDTRVHAVHSSGEYNSDMVKLNVKGSGTQTGVNDILTDEKSNALYYDLNGYKISDPSNGIYIRKSNGKVEKIVK